MLIADRLWIPDGSQAILWDMDGVLLDSLGLDLVICNELLHDHLSEAARVPKEYIRSLFAYDPADFWRMILHETGIPMTPGRAAEVLETILPIYVKARNDATFNVNPGIVDILSDAKSIGIRMAVVSNNPTQDVVRMIAASGLTGYFDTILGNDHKRLNKKPAPDPYLYGAELLKVPVERSVVVEDSLVGLQAGNSAGCFVVGVATGGDTFEQLEGSGLAGTVYTSFGQGHVAGQFGPVTRKAIQTPNDFVSHMIEHIAWRTGYQIDLAWHNDDWRRLGAAVGSAIAKHNANRSVGVAMGMIDDGSAEVSIELSSSPSAEITALPTFDLGWIMALRCEQLRSAEPLKRLIEGLADGVGAKIRVRICSFEDPHHSWEGVFRSIGIALGQMFTPRQEAPDPGALAVQDRTSAGGLQIEGLTGNAVTVSRRTAESLTSISIDLAGSSGIDCTFRTAPSVNVSGLADLLKSTFDEAGISCRILFEALALSSSHVVLEDIGLVIGRALKEILLLRMEHCGTEGEGVVFRLRKTCKVSR